MLDLERFVTAQERHYEIALREVREGCKRSHWMWYIFPKIKGLGHSEKAQFYAIQSAEEAEAYLAHPILGMRLQEISIALLGLPTSDAQAIRFSLVCQPLVSVVCALRVAAVALLSVLRISLQTIDTIGPALLGKFVRLAALDAYPGCLALVIPLVTAFRLPLFLPLSGGLCRT